MKWEAKGRGLLLAEESLPGWAMRSAQESLQPDSSNCPGRPRLIKSLLPKGNVITGLILCPACFNVSMQNGSH